jgi:hypothetical protein
MAPGFEELTGNLIGSENFLLYLLPQQLTNSTIAPNCPYLIRCEPRIITISSHSCRGAPETTSLSVPDFDDAAPVLQLKVPLARMYSSAQLLVPDWRQYL